MENSHEEKIYCPHCRSEIIDLQATSCPKCWGDLIEQELIIQESIEPSDTTEATIETEKIEEIKTPPQEAVATVTPKKTADLRSILLFNSFILIILIITCFIQLIYLHNLDQSVNKLKQNHVKILHQLEKLK